MPTVLVRARIRLLGVKGEYSSTVLADTGARMDVIDRVLAEDIGVEYTGREISFMSISGHTIKALEAVVPEVEVEGERLKYGVVAIADMPEGVKEVLKSNGLDDKMIIGVLTLERANMVPDITTGKLRRTENFIF